VASAADVDTVFAVALAAFPGWRDPSQDQRQAVLFNFRELLHARTGKLAGILEADADALDLAANAAVNAGYIDLAANAAVDAGYVDRAAAEGLDFLNRRRKDSTSPPRVPEARARPAPALPGPAEGQRRYARQGVRHGLAA